MWSKKWEEIAATLQSVFSNTHNTNRLWCPFRKSLQKRIDKENLYGLISNHCSNSFSKIFIMKKSSKSQKIFIFYITLLYSRYSMQRVEEVVNMSLERLESRLQSPRLSFEESKLNSRLKILMTMMNYLLCTGSWILIF